MIAKWPGEIEAGVVSDHVSAFWDISPTLRELAGAEPQVDTDGISMLPTLLGKGVQATHYYLYWEFYEQGGKRAILHHDWKLILFGTNTELNPRAELFNLAAEESERENVAKQYPERVSELRSMMDDAHTLSEHPSFKLAFER